jgi:hypothetical protein
MILNLSMAYRFGSIGGDRSTNQTARRNRRSTASDGSRGSGTATVAAHHRDDSTAQGRAREACFRISGMPPRANVERRRTPTQTERRADRIIRQQR